jgi:hypothetical protein
MDHCELHHRLRRLAATGDVCALGDGLELRTLEFTSAHSVLLPGGGPYTCPEHGVALADPDPAGPVDGGALDVCDIVLRGNGSFRYQVLAPVGQGRARGAILMFHGLNEKDWTKYLPWAYALAGGTGRAVVLFPIAFHMQRAPRAWSERHAMHRAAAARQAAYPLILASSLSNVAISTRLHARPQRFFWSGLQTFHDVAQLLAEIRAGRHLLVAPDARVDLFGYSIGCLLAQVLLLHDVGGLLADARLCMFCGGAVFNRMSPVSRFILDSEANVALYSYVVEHLENHLRDSERLRHHLGEAHPEGVFLRSMLRYDRMRELREAGFRRLAPRLLGLALARDAVAPPYEVVNTLQGAARDIPVRVEVADFDYPYSHEDPFPVVESRRAEVDAAFRRMFATASAFFGPVGR